MILSLLKVLYIFIAILLIPVILLQKGKSSMGLGGMGGGTQMLFGGSGGQELFQQITWALVALFMGGSLVISTMATKHTYKPRYLSSAQQQR